MTLSVIILSYLLVGFVGQFGAAAFTRQPLYDWRNELFGTLVWPAVIVLWVRRYVREQR